ncbi:MAG TPA: helix-turn-helix transcriptional regulator [Ktedonosporobacter sp.]|nr:helix-turn-helix transcriptional regulator [Ktedonosporobacter sp.]
MWDGISILHPPNQILALLFILLYLIWIELRRAREARGWTAEEAAERLGVDVRTYLGWERGECQPRPLNRLALQRTYRGLGTIRRTAVLLESS